MSRCEQELCQNWAGDGCVCTVLDLEPDVVREHSDDCDSPENMCADCLFYGSDDQEVTE